MGNILSDGPRVLERPIAPTTFQNCPSIFSAVLTNHIFIAALTIDHRSMSSIAVQNPPPPFPSSSTTVHHSPSPSSHAVHCRRDHRRSSYILPPPIRPLPSIPYITVLHCPLPFLPSIIVYHSPSTTVHYGPSPSMIIVHHSSRHVARQAIQEKYQQMGGGIFQAGRRQRKQKIKSSGRPTASYGYSTRRKGCVEEMFMFGPPWARGRRQRSAYCQTID